jgi:hypothetical protein
LEGDLVDAGATVGVAVEANVFDADCLCGLPMMGGDGNAPGDIFGFDA